MHKKTSKNPISRRDTLRLIGAAGVTALAGWRGERGIGLRQTTLPGSVAEASQLSCVVRPQLTEGPYFVDERLNRSDIRTDPATGVVKSGVPLTLRFNVTRVSGNSCTPLAGAYVDIWHCNAAGSYSDVRDAGFDTRGQKYLRGYQVTDNSGAAQFLTIYPGWYSGRAVHIHFKIRLFTGSQETYEFTSQLFFSDSLNNQVYSQAPYSAHGSPDTRNSRDGIFNNGGSQLLLNATQEGQGYAATFDIGLEGITEPDPITDPPIISAAAVTGNRLIVTGQNFDSGAKLFMNGDKQKAVRDESSPTTALVAKKAGKKIAPGNTVTLQVRNPDNSLSNEFPFARPVE